MMVVLVDLNVVDLGEGGPSSLLRPRWVVPTLGRRLRTGLPLRPLTRGVAPPTSPQAWPTAVWRKTLRPSAHRLASACRPDLEPPFARVKAACGVYGLLRARCNHFDPL